MSDTDDTDVLLLIPPDLFTVLPSDSEDDLSTKPGVVSEIIGHVQSLESRISAIESRDNSFDSASTFRQNPSSFCDPQHSVSQSSIVLKTPPKPRRCSSVPSTPCSYITTRGNMRNETNHLNTHPRLRTNNTLSLWDKHEQLTSLSDSTTLKSGCRTAPQNLHASLKKDYLHNYNNYLLDIHSNSVTSRSMPYVPARRSLFVSNTSQNSTDNFTAETKKIEDMNLNEVEELLREFEMSEHDVEESRNVGKNEGSIRNHENRFQLDSYAKCNKVKTESRDKLGDLLLLSNEDSTQYADPEKLISDFNMPKLCNDEDNIRSKNIIDKAVDSKHNGHGISVAQDKSRNMYGSDLGTSYYSNNETKNSLNSKYPDVTSELFDSLNNTLSKVANGSEPGDSLDMFLEPFSKVNIEDELKSLSCNKKNSDNSNPDSCLLKSQGLLALSDFWEHDNTKSQEEILRIKIEEEKLRREHCEHMIQELQKKLLEQQEKVAVAIQIDNKKNLVISHFQNSWKKIKQKHQNLESEYNNTQTLLKNLTEKHQLETTDLQNKISKCRSELSQALDLAGGYKEKSDILVKEKVDMVKAHVDELENHKILIEQKEMVSEQMKADCNKMKEKVRQMDELLQNVQQDLNTERSKNTEVRNEMAAIHKALDTCGAELNVLRQDKENLKQKLKEETNRCNSLEQNKLALLSAIDDAKKAEKQAKDETATLVEQQEKIRCELRDVYQKQLDEVVKAKQQEFQTQLDSAEGAFQSELDTRQRAIAECAARKIKTVIDKHQLEINLLEEKHKEEKRLYELQLAQAVQKSSLLEAQLHSQQTSKNQLVEQLHSVMQRQWQQALRIISGGNGENLAACQKINMDKFFELKNPISSDASVNHCYKAYQDPVKLATYQSNNIETQGIKSRDDRAESLVTLTSNDDIVLNKKDSKNDLRGYIQMILDMQQSSKDILKSRLTDSTATSPPVYREVPKKHYTKKELSIMSEDSVTWHPISEASGAETSEYIAIPQKLGKEQSKIKPPWK